MLVTISSLQPKTANFSGPSQCVRILSTFSEWFEDIIWKYFFLKTPESSFKSSSKCIQVPFIFAWSIAAPSQLLDDVTL